MSIPLRNPDKRHLINDTQVQAQTNRSWIYFPSSPWNLIVPCGSSDPLPAFSLAAEPIRSGGAGSTCGAGVHSTNLPERSFLIDDCRDLLVSESSSWDLQKFVCTLLAGRLRRRTLTRSGIP